jgi:uncharacterized protein YndB with AHSA1/START domain
MLKKIFIGLGVIIAIILIAAAFQPSTFHVERSAVVKASPAVVYAQVNDFRNWSQFNPWQELDTNAKLTFSGPNNGVGSKFQWAGNSNMGTGEMTITGSKPNERVDIDMHFIEPMEGKATTAFALQPEGSGTKVTWSMEGENNYMGKIMCLFMNMDDMIGKEYEKGLAKLGELPATATVEAKPSVFVREFDAPREAVWNAWTKPEEHMKWWGPQMFTCPAAKMDVREGGTYHVAMRGMGMTFWNRGEYKEVVPMEKLVYTVQFADSLGNVVPPSFYKLPGQWPEAVITTSTFEEVSGKTKFTLVEEGVPAEQRLNSEMGMNQCLDKLTGFLARNSATAQK